MPTIFLSYRRNDTAGEAGRLADALQYKLGQRFVFRDVVSISPGDRFDTVLEEQLAIAKVVLVLIGTTWLGELQKRVAEEGMDFHRAEVATALSGRKRVIPVLLRGAALPPPAALPADLLALTKCQAITIRDESWTADIERLIDAIGHPYRLDLLLVRALIASVSIILAAWKLVPQLAPDLAADYGFLRGLVFALVIAYGLVEFVVAHRYLQKLNRARETK